VTKKQFDKFVAATHKAADKAILKASKDIKGQSEFVTLRDRGIAFREYMSQPLVVYRIHLLATLGILGTIIILELISYV